MVNPDPVAMAIVIKAVDFLFGEAGKILEERRTARQKRGEETKQASSEQKSIPSEIAITPQKLKKLKPQSVKLHDISQDVEHCIRQIRQYETNKKFLENEAAAYGGFIYAPLHVKNQIRNAEQEIYDNSWKLKNLLEEVYNQKIKIEGLE